MDKKTISLYLFFIILVASVFRLYKLGSLPPSLNWDEVSFGYNAYSILKTGKDEFGKVFPVYFRSLDDYKLPVYMYLTVVSIAIFGYNDFAVRFPSSFAGILLVYIVYKLVQELSYFSKIKYKNFIIDKIGLFSALVLSVQPWNVQYSRMAAEANVGLLLLIFGVYGFLKFLRVRKFWGILSFLSFFLACYSYLSIRVMVILLLPFLILLFWKCIKEIPLKNNHIAFGIILIIFFIFGEVIFFGIPMRYKGTNAFDDNYEFIKAEKEMKYDALKGINIPRRIFHDSKILTSLFIASRNYLSHFSPEFLFFDLEAKHHHAPNVGLLYLFLVPLILIGFIQSRELFGQRGFYLLLFLLAISPFAAAFTRDVPHPIRSFGMSIIFAIYSGIGLFLLNEYCINRKRQLYILFIGIITMTAIFFISYFVHQYIVHLPAERSDKWQYGRKELSEFLNENKSKYEKILVSSSLEWPYEFYLYYGKINPKHYLSEGGTFSGGWGNNSNKYENIEFRAFDTKKDKTTKNMLFIGLESEFPNTVDPILIIHYPNGDPAIYIISGEDTAIN